MIVDSEYIETAVRHAAIALLWQASDATEDGNGFPISDGGNEYSDMVVTEVPYLTEAVTAFLSYPQTGHWLEVDNVSAAMCGHDFILTANHHGVGFWDRGYRFGDQLTSATRGYSFEAEFALWGDDADGDEHCSDEVSWLMVENVVLVDERNWSA